MYVTFAFISSKRKGGKRTAISPFHEVKDLLMMPRIMLITSESTLTCQSSAECSSAYVYGLHAVWEITLVQEWRRAVVCRAAVAHMVKQASLDEIY